MQILVTGGAGYIGSIVTEKLVACGFRVTVVDSLRTGHRAAIPEQAEFVQLDLREKPKLLELFAARQFEAVLHFAAISLVGDSVLDPSGYYHNNVLGTLTLLDCMMVARVPALVFSSTAAVYGEPRSVPIQEDAALIPTSPYGSTKLAMEDAIKWYGKAYSIRSTILRYFNAAGATLERGEDHRPETHLIPRLLLSALENEPVTLFGSDYPTRDGTAIRDYIHVEDLAKAHLKALDYLLQGGASLTCNLGSGGGYTVREVLEAARKATGQPLQEKLAPRRAGDPAVLVASPELAKTALSWKPERGLEEMVVSAWAWRQRYPGGYS